MYVMSNVLYLQTSDSDQTLGDSKKVQREHKPETSASESGMFCCIYSISDVMLIDTSLENFIVSQRYFTI